MKRLVTMLGALAATGLILWGVLLLGSWAFSTRSGSIHYGRLARLVERQPRIDQVTSALHQEGSPLVDSARGEDETRRVAARWGDGKVDEILDKSRRFAQTRVFQAGDAIYFLYFDSEGILKDFTLVSR